MFLCTNGQKTNTCNPGNSVTETCNNIDDDCDGSVDEDNTLCLGTKPYCSPGGCVECLENIHCDNDLYCDGVEICDSNKNCDEGNPVACKDNNPNTYDFCNETSDSCQSINIILDSDNDDVPDSFDRCPNTPTRYRNKVNNKGCPNPEVEGFDIITNLSGKDLSKVKSFKIGITGKGIIRFGANVSLINEIGEPLNFSFINISKGRIEIKRSGLVELNKPAELFIYGLNLSNPRILKDGIVCSDCNTISWNKTTGEIRFNVTGFSVYEVVEAFCGDGYCDNGEDCSSCPGDCGRCPSGGRSSGSGGGGGSGSGIIRRTSLINETNYSQTKTDLETIVFIDNGTWDGENEDQDVDEEESEDTFWDYLNKNKIYFIYGGVSFIVLVLLLVIIWVVIRRLKKKKIKSTRFGLKGNETIKRQKEIISGQTQEINKLLILGGKHLSGGDIDNAKKIYRKIKGIYKPGHDKDKKLYKKIIVYYEDLSRTKNR